MKKNALWLAVSVVALWSAGALGQEDPGLAEAAKAPNVSGLVRPYVAIEGVDGNDAWAGRYRAPHSEIGLDIEDLSIRTDDGFDSLDAWAHGLFGYQQNALVQAWTRALPARLRLRYRRSTLSAEPSLGRNPLDSDLMGSGDLLVRPTHWVAVYGGYRTDTDRLGALARGGTINHRVNEFWGGVNVDTGLGVLGAYYSTSNYVERALGRPSSSTQAFGLTYDALFGQRLTLSGAAKWARVRQPGYDTSTIFAAGVGASYAAARNLSFDARWRYRDVDWTPTRNAYLGRTNGGGLGLTYRPLKPLTLRLGFDLAEHQRFDALQTRVEKPGETRFYARADYRAAHSLRGSLGYQRRDLTRLKNTTEPTVFDSSPLLVDTDQRFDARLSRAIGAEGLGYAFYQHRWFNLSDRSQDHAVGTIGLGVAMPIAKALTASADWYYRYVTDSDPDLEYYATDTMVIHGGLGWSPDSRWRVSADYHWVRSYHGQSTDGSYLAATLGYQISPRAALQVSYARDGYDGGTEPVQAYDADILRVSYSQRF